jgi:serine protease inhibitor
MRSYIATLRRPEAGVYVVWDVADTGWGWFRVDQPFLFIILDRENGNILFMGHVMNPTE